MSVNMGKELTEELKKFERPRAPTGRLIRKHADGSWKISQAKEYPRAMSAGIAAAMVRAACKHQKVPGIADLDEAAKQFAFFRPIFYTLLRLLG